jgi:hypothetical protein
LWSGATRVCGEVRGQPGAGVKCLLEGMSISVDGVLLTTLGLCLCKVGEHVWTSLVNLRIAFTNYS